MEAYASDRAKYRAQIAEGASPEDLAETIVRRAERFWPGDRVAVILSDDGDASLYCCRNPTCGGSSGCGCKKPDKECCVAKGATCCAETKAKQQGCVACCMGAAAKAKAEVAKAKDKVGSAAADARAAKARGKEGGAKDTEMTLNEPDSAPAEGDAKASAEGGAKADGSEGGAEKKCKLCCGPPPKPSMEDPCACCGPCCGPRCGGVCDADDPDDGPAVPTARDRSGSDMSNINGDGGGEVVTDQPSGAKSKVGDDVDDALEPVTLEECGRRGVVCFPGDAVSAQRAEGGYLMVRFDEEPLESDDNGGDSDGDGDGGDDGSGGDSGVAPSNGGGTDDNDIAATADTGGGGVMATEAAAIAPNAKDGADNPDKDSSGGGRGANAAPAATASALRGHLGSGSAANRATARKVVTLKNVNLKGAGATVTAVATGCCKSKATTRPPPSPKTGFFLPTELALLLSPIEARVLLRCVVGHFFCTCCCTLATELT